MTRSVGLKMYPAGQLKLLLLNSEAHIYVQNIFGWQLMSLFCSSKHSQTRLHFQYFTECKTQISMEFLYKNLQNQPSFTGPMSWK